MYKTLQSLINTSNYDVFLDLFPILSKLKDTPQDSFYHAEGDVWTHTKMVLDSLRENHINKPFDQYSLEKQFIIFYSALFHDIAKPVCTKHEGTRITSKGHSKLGSFDTRKILYELDIPFQVRESICNIISTHQVPFFAFSEHNNLTPEYMAYDLSYQLPLDCLLEVAYADMNGRHFVDKQNALDDIKLFHEVISEENCLTRPYAFPDDITKVEYFLKKNIANNYPFYKETGSNGIMLSGLPCSGKSSVRNTQYKDLPVISFDDIKEELGVKQGDNTGQVYQHAINEAKKLLRKHESFVWDSTNITNLMRNKTLSLLYDYNAHVKMVYKEKHLHTLLKDNSTRDTIPNAKILGMLNKWNMIFPNEVHDVEYLVNDLTLKHNFLVE